MKRRERNKVQAGAGGFPDDFSDDSQPTRKKK
jgi:hypothetical protein